MSSLSGSHNLKKAEMERHAFKLELVFVRFKIVQLRHFSFYTSIHIDKGKCSHLGRKLGIQIQPRHRYRCGRSKVRSSGRSDGTQCCQRLAIVAIFLRTLNLCCSVAKLRRWAPPLVMRFGVIPRVRYNEDLNFFFIFMESIKISKYF